MINNPLVKELGLVEMTEEFEREEQIRNNEENEESSSNSNTHTDGADGEDLEEGGCEDAEEGGEGVAGEEEDSRGSVRSRQNSSSSKNRPEAAVAALNKKKRKRVFGDRRTQHVDIFSLGCVFHWILVPGVHPFGQWYEREANIMANKADLSGLRDMPDALDLIDRMIRRLQFFLLRKSPFFPLPYLPHLYFNENVVQNSHRETLRPASMSASILLGFSETAGFPTRVIRST